MIVVESLGKRFRDIRRGEVVALEDASFHCRAGEIFGLLGPNGAGKTTTMRILSTVLQPTSGRAIVAGFDVVRQPAEVRRHIGFLSTSTGLYDRMTAWEHVEYFGKLYRLEASLLRERMERVFQDLAMNDFRETLVAKMSTGMRQKVSIARTIIHDPPVLIFDEPTSGLDVLVSRSVLQNIERLRDEGKTIIYSTHIMREVEKLCDRVAIIHRGSILEQGSLPEVIARHGQGDMESTFFALIEDAERAATAVE